MQTVPQPVCQPAGSIVWQTFLFVFVLQTTSAQTYQSAIENILLQAYQSAMWGKWVQGQHTNQAIKVKILIHIRI